MKLYQLAQFDGAILLPEGSYETDLREARKIASRHRKHRGGEWVVLAFEVLLDNQGEEEIRKLEVQPLKLVVKKY